MKKLFYSASALVALLLAASCQQENLEPEVSASSVTYSVEVPQVETKAIGDGQNVNQLIYEVWRTASKNDKTLTEAPGTERLFVGEAVVENGKATFQVDLVNDQNYTLLFWAQVKDKGFYNTSDLKNVTFNGGKKWVANDDARAAFYGIDHIDGENPKAEETVELTRPFAQLNLGSVVRTQAQDKVYELTADQAFVKVTGAATSFNVATAAAGSETMTTAFAKADDPEETLTVNGTGYDWVAMNYFFVPANQATVKVDYTIYTNHGEVTNTVENVPVQMNYRTNIIGNLLTSTTDYTVELDTDWGGNDNVVEVITDGLVKIVNTGVYQISTANGLAYASQNLFDKGGKFILLNDVDMAGASSVVTKATGLIYNSAKLTHKMAGGSFEFDGGNYTIKNLPGMFVAYTGSAKSVVVKNLTLDTPNVAFNVEDNPETDGVGAFIGYAGTSETITLENCHVKGGKIEGGHWTGGLVGYAAGYSGNDGPVFETLTIKDCSVKNAIVTGKGSAGGIIGHATGDAWTLVDMDNITVTSNTISSTGESKEKAGSVMGTLGIAGAPKTVNGVTKTGGTTIDDYEVSGNRVESNKVANTKLWGRQAGGVLTLDGEKVEDFGSYTEPASEFTDENGVYTLQKITASALTDILADAESNTYGDITIQLDEDQALSWAAGPAGDGANKLSHDGKVTIKNGTLSVTGAGSFVVENELVLEGVTVVDNTAYYSENGETAWEFCYLELTAKGTYKNCVFENTIMVDGQEATFENCKFLGKSTNEANAANEYSVWVYNGTAKFVECDIYGARGMKVCDMYSGSDVTKVEIDGCTFNDFYKKPGLAIDNRIGDLAVTIENSIFTDVQPGDQGLYIYETDNVVPTIKNSKVIIDGKEVLAFDEDGYRVVVVTDDDELDAAIKSASVKSIISLAEGNYSEDINLTVANYGAAKGDIIFRASEGAEPVIAGTITLGYRNQGVGATMWNGNVTFEGITFDHAAAATHSIDVQDVKSLTLRNCKLIGDGEYGLTSARGNATGTSSIVGCTFENAGMQLLGNFATGLVIDYCKLEQSCINVQAGNSVTVRNCEFENKLTSANLGESFYLIRSNSTPITVKDCNINIDSELTEVAAGQAKWGILWNRGTTNWTVEDVQVTMTEAAVEQTELMVTKCTSTGVINFKNLFVNGTELLPAGVSQNDEDVWIVDENVSGALNWLKTNKAETLLNGKIQYGTAVYAYGDNGTEVTMTAAGEDAKTSRYLVGASVTDVTVAEGIKVIGDRTFRDAPNLECVTLPESLTELEEGAFQSCGLTAITIPGENVTLGKQSIGYLPNLETIVIEATNVTIGNYVARACPKLKSVYIYSQNVSFLEGSMYFTDCESNNTSGITYYVASQEVADAVNASVPSGHAKGMQIKNIYGTVTYYTR